MRVLEPLPEDATYDLIHRAVTKLVREEYGDLWDGVRCRVDNRALEDHDPTNKWEGYVDPRDRKWFLPRGLE